MRVGGSEYLWRRRASSAKGGKEGVGGPTTPMTISPATAPVPSISALESKQSSFVHFPIWFSAILLPWKLPRVACEGGLDHVTAPLLESIPLRAKPYICLSFKNFGYSILGPLLLCIARLLPYINAAIIWKTCIVVGPPFSTPQDSPDYIECGDYKPLRM